MLHKFKAEGAELMRLGKEPSQGDMVSLEPGDGWDNVEAIIAAFYVPGAKEDAYWCDSLGCAVPRHARSRRFEVAFVGVMPDGSTIETARCRVA